VEEAEDGEITEGEIKSRIQGAGSMDLSGKRPVIG